MNLAHIGWWSETRELNDARVCQRACWNADGCCTTKLGCRLTLVGSVGVVDVGGGEGR